MIDKIKKIIPAGEFVKNVSTLTVGTLAAQIISVITLPILTRLYSPSEFGIFGLYSSVAAIVSVVAAGRYEFAIMLPKKEEEADNLVTLSTIICVTLSFLSVVIIGLFGQPIALLLNNTAETFWLWLAPVGIFTLTYYNIMNYWSNRLKKYKQLAYSRISRAIFNSGVGLSFGLLNWTSVGLIFGVIIGDGISSLYLLWQNKTYTIRKQKNLNKPELLRIAKEYSDFPKKSIPGSFLNILSGQLPVLLLANLYGVTVVGLYILTLRILSVPMNLLGKSVSQVFYQRAVEALEDGKLWELVKMTTIHLFLIIIIPMSVIIVFGKELFSFIFGANWASAGELAQIMAPFFLVRFVFSSQSTLMMVLRRMDFEIKFNFIFLLSQLLSLFIGYYILNDYVWSFILMSVSGLIVFIWLGFFIVVSSKQYNKNII